MTIGLLPNPERAARLRGSRPGSEFLLYVGRMRQFSRQDWLVYVAWVGLMLGLVGVGHAGGVALSPAAYLVPAGALVFTLSIAIDTIGHRTVYREEIQQAE